MLGRWFLAAQEVGHEAAAPKPSNPAMKGQMMKLLRCTLLLAFLWPALSSSEAADATERRYRLPGHGYLQMKVPSTWADEVRQPGDDLPPTVMFLAREGRQFAVLATPIWPARADVPPQTLESIRRTVQESAERVRPEAVETTIEIVELQGASGSGYYFFVTDRAPKPDEYEFMTQGIVKVGELTMTFTILTNRDQEDIARDALEVIKSAVQIVIQ